ncbi:MAG TPA: N-methyl-L-tryptophan oxidase [Candidatus Acidoferrum sp.]|nr:N-methyl-L-tryptophan oxidase [Candidatus Acidoferrum sp.]
MAHEKTYDVAVIGAGVFGSWTALTLARSGRRVALIDAYGPGNARASSGGESRLIRMGYGPDELYTRWSVRSLELWKEFFASVGRRLFHKTGILWIANQEEDAQMSATLEVLARVGVPHERLTGAELAQRYPQIAFRAGSWGLLEPDSGVLMARRAVAAVAEAAVAHGAEYFNERVSVREGKGRVALIKTESGGEIRAEQFVFACGPWLGKIFPEILGQRIFPTRQEIYFFGVPAGDSRFAPPAMPGWLCQSELMYGVPDLESRGFKIALDRHGPPFDPDTGARVPSAESIAAMRVYLAQRFPALVDAPLVEARVCQYENTSNGDFLVDRHPEHENVWLVGGGSGHGFKHGPAMGEHVAARVLDKAAQEPRFSLSTKATAQRRSVY